MNALPTQLELVPEEQVQDQVAQLRRVLTSAGWCTRKVLHLRLGWDERTIRAVAEAAGDLIVRGQKGFCLFEDASSDDILAACGGLESQATKNTAYCLALRSKLHRRIG